MEQEDDNSSWYRRFVESHATCASRPEDPGFGAVFIRGRGSTLWDKDGREWIDLTCGFSVNNFGHCFEPFIAAASQQLTTLSHLTGDIHIGRIQLAEKLLELCWWGDKAGSVVFNSSGARAIETAWKAATCYRPGQLIALSPSLHGRTIATSAISSTNTTELSQKLRPATYVHTTNYPHCEMCPIGKKFPGCEIACIEELENYIKRNHETISALVFEPVMTARGYIFPPAEYFRKLRRLTREYGILLIADEIQSGLGRCAPFARSITDELEPDLIAYGKSLGGGTTPIAGVVGDKEILESIPQGAESETFAATPLACSVAIRVLKELESNDHYDHGCRIGKRLRELCSQFATAETCAVEGQGATCVLEFARSLDEIKAAKKDAYAAAAGMAKNLLRVQLTGPQKTRVVMLPAITMSESELKIASERLKQSLRSLG